jgi:uncharacterized protein (TIGR02271 family)
MDHSTEQFVPSKGMTVYGSDEEKVGDIDTVERDYFVVRKGFFFPEDHFIPMDAVSTYDDDAVYLRYTKDQVLEQQWNTEPVSNERTTSGAYGTDDAFADTSAEGGMERDPEPFVHEQDSQRTHVNEDDNLRIDVREEELVARRREVDRGAVTLEKQVIEEEQSVDVPVTEERVEVTRRPVDRDVVAADRAFEEQTIEVPVHGEDVEVERHARVVEEIDVDTLAATHTERVRDTVRREEVTIDGETEDDASRR